MNATGGATRWALTGLSLSILLSSLGTSIATVALPTMAQAFHAPFEKVQWIVLAYLIAITTLVVAVGWLGDTIGRRRLLLGGTLLFTMASVLCGAAQTLTLVVAARAMQGIGAAIMLVLAMAYVREIVPKESTGRAIGLLGTMSAVGTALGPPLGGILIAGFNWRAIFLVNVPLGSLALLLAYRWLPKDRQWEATPTIRLAMLREPALSAGLAISLLAATVVMTTLVIGPFYLSGTLALDVVQVGLVMSSGPTVAALTGVPAGRMVDRFGAGRLTMVGLGTMMSGSSILATMPATLGVPSYVASLTVITAGYALFQAANNTAVMSIIGRSQQGVVSGMLNLSRNLGLIAGASIMGAVFAHGSVPTIGTTHADAVATGMRTTYAVATMLLGIAFAIARGRKTQSGTPFADAARLPLCKD